MATWSRRCFAICARASTGCPGKYPLCFLCRRIDRAAIQGLPVAELNPYQVEEKPGLGSGSGALVLMNQHPNPNAAKVFIHWLLSPEGQTAFLIRMHDPQPPHCRAVSPASGALYVCAEMK
jgi:hypothetical protein